MDLRVSTCFVVLTHCFWYGDARNIKPEGLSAKNGGDWGLSSAMGLKEVCEKGYANGFAIKVAEDQGLNGIRLYCDNGQTVASRVGGSGTWSDPTYCPKGHLISFQLRMELYQEYEDGDNVAHNIRFLCTGRHVLTGHGHELGEFGPWSEPCSSSAICGLQTMVEPSVFSSGNGALNGVQFLCCD